MAAAPLHLFTIPFGIPFARSVAEGVIARAGGNPLALADSLVLVPTRRAARTLRDAFAEAQGGAALGPSIRALGDIGEDDILFDPASDDLELPPAIRPLRRKLLLATLVQKWSAARDSSLPIAQAVNHAGELARLLDEVTTQGADLTTLAKLAPPELAEHWNEVVKFLDIVANQWPHVLDDEGVIEPAQHRDMLLRGLGARLLAAPPKTPVIAAGSTGSIPATAELLKVVASLPSGAVVLPGLDLAMDSESWEALDPGHAQYGLRELLTRMGAERADVAEWSPVPASVPSRAARVRFVAEALRPPPTTDAWRELLAEHAGDLRPAFENFRLVEAANPREEALTIAVALRGAIETKDKTAALVTPDRALARRVAAELSRWDIAIDDSAGTPLSRTPMGSFLALLARAAAEQFAPVPLLALLKHPLAAGGDERAAFVRRVRQLEKDALRGLRPEPGLAGIAARLEQKLERKKTWPDLIEWFSALAQRFAPFAAAMAKADVPLSELAAAHAEVAEALAATGGRDDGKSLWRREDGESAASLIAELMEQGTDIIVSRGQEYDELFRGLAEMRPVRREFEGHPRLAILGPLEARLQHFDLVVLGGLSEGTWPGQIANDPFLSRGMRAALGLEAPERRVGLAAHDFAGLTAAPEVLLTWPAKKDGTPVVSSRWLQRIVQLAAGLNAVETLAQSEHIAHARELDVAPAVKRIPRPRYAPRAPLRGLSVTNVETWLRDPYAIYAKYILRLKKLDPLEQEPGPRERGMAVHAALEAFHKEFPNEMPADAEARLLAHGEIAFREAGATSETLVLWRPRFARAIEWFVDYERDRRGDVARSIAEVKGELEIPRAVGTFALVCRADRIDILNDGKGTIIDYKTGQAPSGTQIEKLIVPQLPLEAAMLIHGGFEGLPATPMHELIHVRLGGREPPGKDSVVGADPNALAERAIAQLKNRIARFDAGYPYHSRVMTFTVREVGDYDQLARVREWAIVEDDPLAAPA